MIVIAGISLFRIIIFALVIFGAATVVCASLGDPLFAETPGDEFADDEPRVRACARPHCDRPQYRDSLCLPHYEWWESERYEFRREIEDYERGLSR